MARIALQLYTVKDDVARGLVRVLEQVAEMGYDGVEFAGVPEFPAAGLLPILRDLGLATAGIVAPMHQLADPEALAKVIDYNHAIGCKTVLFPWLNDEFRGSAENYRRTADILAGFGQTLADNGLRFLYHTHGYEFQDFGGETGLDILMANTPANTVGLEPDTYWILHGGADPLTVYRKYRDRCYSIHFKDMNNRAEMRDIEVGDGIVDIPGILAAAKGSISDWFIVEQEQFDQPPLESARISCRNLQLLVKEHLNK